jgi:hypothetical protein
MAGRKPKKVREQVVVYLDARDRALLEELTERTGISRTELFRRGLHRVATELSGERVPGSSLSYLAESAAEDAFPADVAERHHEYLYGGEYERAVKPKRARSR